MLKLKLQPFSSSSHGAIDFECSNIVNGLFASTLGMKSFEEKILKFR